MSRTRIVIISFFVLACCLGSSNEVRSEEIGPAGEEIPTVEKKPVVLIDDVVVTVNRADRQEFELPRSVEVISSDSVRKKNPKSLPDLLDETTGVYVQKTNPGAGSPIIRGFVGPENLILIVGVRFNNSTFRTGPNQYLAMIDPWSVERLEVLRGPGSVMYGTDAMGGVINAVTLSPRKLDDRLFGVTGRLDFASAYLHAGGSAQADLATGPVSGYVGGTFNH